MKILAMLDDPAVDRSSNSTNFRRSRRRTRSSNNVSRSAAVSSFFHFQNMPFLSFVLLLHCFWWTVTTNISGVVEAVLSGDEQYQDIPGGRFWAFTTNGGISIFNADTCAVEHTFKYDSSGHALPEKWNDGVYMEETTTTFTKETSTGNHYILILSGVTSYDNNDVPQGEILVVSTDPKYYESTKQKAGGYYEDDNTGKGGGGPVLWRIPLSSATGRRYSSYGVYKRNEFWTIGHGQLFVISLNLLSLSSPHQQIAIQATAFRDESQQQQQPISTGDSLNPNDDDDGALHGMLLWDESEHLSGYGYITGGHDQSIHIVDLDTKTPVGLFNYSSFVDVGECNSRRSAGSKGIAYSSRNKHLYVECGWSGPILEIDLQNPTEPQFVTKHEGVGGWLHETSIVDTNGRDTNNNLVIVTDRHQNKLHILLPNANGQPSSIDYQVSVPGRPDKMSMYHYQYETGETDDILCMPLTENVNRNNMDSNGNVVCDVFDCGPPITPQDVASGMCLWDTNNTDELLRAPLSDFDKVVNGETPYLNRCPRCKIRDSYRGGDICTCTPHCGSCASDDYDVSNTGVRCIKLQDALNSKTSGNSNNNNDGADNDDLSTAKLIEGAGAVRQEEPTFRSAQCGYGWTHRSSTRGGKYHVSVAHFPSNSLQVVDMSTQSLSCQVDLPGQPDRVMYVPPQRGQKESYKMVKTGGLSTAGKTVLIIFCTLLAVLVLVMTISIKGRGSRMDDGEVFKSDENLANRADADLELTASSPGIDGSKNSSLPEIT